MDRVLKALLLAQLPNERAQLDGHWNDYACGSDGILGGLCVLDRQAIVLLSSQGV